MSQGVKYILLSGLFFALMNVAVKALSHLPVFEVVFFRALISLLICFVLLKFRRVSPWGNNKKILIFRGVFGTFGLCLYFYTIQKIPLATAITLQYMSPLFVVLASWIFLREKVELKQFLFFIVASIGVVFVKGFDAQISLALVFCGLLGALCSGIAYTCVRKLGSSETPLVIVLYFPLVCLPLVAPLAYHQWEPPKGWDWLILGIIGVTTQMAQIFLTKAFQVERAAHIAIFNYLGIVYAIILGYILFQETLSWTTCLGIVLILTGVITGRQGRKLQVKLENSAASR